jgi:hypothetical protein
MASYILTVFHEGDIAPTERVTASRASEVLDQIRSLLGKHPHCHRIRVETTAGFLFAVDCKGATVFEGQGTVARSESVRLFRGDS